MNTALIVIQLLLAIFLVGSILLQPGESGFSAGGLMAGGEHYSTRRGLERTLFYASFVLIALFVVLNLWLVR